MIVGSVNENIEATISLDIVTADKTLRRIEAIIDTGFNGSLTLPSAVVKSLHLEWQSHGDAILGDGSLHAFDAYQATIVWDGRERIIVVDEAEVEPLVGMSLIQGFVLQLHAVKSGKVQLTPMTLS